MTALRSAPIRSAPAAPQCLDVLVQQLLVELAEAEAGARAALPQVERVGAWAPWSMDTGLSRAQEDFVDAWSPQRVLEHCQAQRQLASLLQARARSHPGDLPFLLSVLELATT